MNYWSSLRIRQKWVVSVFYDNNWGQAASKVYIIYIHINVGQYSITIPQRHIEAQYASIPTAYAPYALILFSNSIVNQLSGAISQA